MKENVVDINKINIGFGNMADEYDSMQETNMPVKLMRQKFYSTVISYVKPPAKMLELNCGSGIDAHYFASAGFDVTATDVSDKMLFNAKSKGEKENLKFKKLNLLELEKSDEKKFDIIISNLGGLNCLNDLSKISRDISLLLNSGGYFISVLMPQFCLWEFALIFKLEFDRAFRRIRNNIKANVGGEKILIRYYSPKKYYDFFKKEFKQEETIALRVFAPPQPAFHWYKKHPVITKVLDFFDNKIENVYPFSFIGDYYISVLKKFHN